MKKYTQALFCLLLLLMTCVSHARLGDTRDQAEARYGLPKSEKPSGTPLLEGSKELTFHQDLWTIRCALLLAKDGREYVVRQTYHKRWDPSVINSGTNDAIADHERDWLLNVEAGTRTWTKRSSTGYGDTLKESLIKQFLVPREWNLGTIWLREDGAIARMEGLNRVMMFDLPQARKYEAELKAIKEAQASARSLQGLSKLERDISPPSRVSADHQGRSTERCIET